MTIYKESAKAYWDQGLKTIPMYPFSDLPNLKNLLRPEKITQADQDKWAEHYPNFNVGCMAGEASRLTFIEVFTQRANLQGMIEEILPPTSWIMTEDDRITYGYDYHPDLECFEILTQAKEPIVRLKGNGQSQILPPSTRGTQSLPLVLPETANDQISPLPSQLEEMLRGILLSEKVKLYPKGSSRVFDTLPKGRIDYELRVKADALNRETLSANRTIQECLDYLESYCFSLGGEESAVGEAQQRYFEFLREDMNILGKSLPLTWANGLKSPKDVPFAPEDTEKSYEQLKHDVYEAITSNFHDDEGRLRAVQYTLEMINKATTLDEIQEDLLVRYISKQSNLGITAATLRRRLRVLNTGECPGENQSEIAEVFLKQLNRIAPYAYYSDSYWLFDGSCWVSVIKRTLTLQIGAMYGHLPAAKKAHDHNGILNIVTGSLQGYLVSECYAGSSGVNFSNGYLTDTLKLIPHNKDLGTQYVLPFPYDAGKAHANNRPMFNQFLKDCWGDDEDYVEKVQALRESMAVTLFGMAYKYQKVFLLFGVPKSGKSQLLNIISSLVPSAAKTSLPPTEWAERFRSAQMHGKILNIAGELSENKLIDGYVFKDIVDGTEQLGEHKGTNLFRFVPKCAHWFASNHFPKTKDTSEGFIRRWLILTFSKPVPEGATIIRDLGNHIALHERDSIVAWCIEALPSLLTSGEYTATTSHIEALGDVANQNNSARFFMTGSGLVQVKDPSLKGKLHLLDEQSLKSLPYLTGDVLHTVYSNFLLGEGGVRPVSSEKFHRLMLELSSQLGIKQQRVRCMNGRSMYIYCNLRLSEHLAGTPNDPENPMSEKKKLSMEKMISIVRTGS